jgi:drug/metabolite transporter (DMT)-like permease
VANLRTAVLFLVLAAVWGAAFTAIKAGLAYFPPVLFAALRYDVAGVVVLGYAAVATDRWRPRGRDEWLLVGVGGLFLIAAYHAFLFVGEQGTTSAAAAIIVSLSPVLTTGFARLLLPDERLTLVGLVGLATGFVGVAVLSYPAQGPLLTGDTVAKLLVFAAAASFAFGSVLARRLETALPLATMEAWSMVVGAVVLHVASGLLGESPAAVRWTPDALVALGYLGIVASALGFLVYFALLETLGPIRINLVSYAAPVAAAVTGFVLLAETPTLQAVTGFAVILLGFGLIQRDAIRDSLAGR